MQSYFAKYGKLVSTFVNNPHLVNFFENWDTRDQPIKNAPGYNEVNQDFVRISSNDENVLSAFFASATTGEYFKENERTSHYNGQPYYAYKRGWWQEALQIHLAIRHWVVEKLNRIPWPGKARFRVRKRVPGNPMSVLKGQRGECLQTQAS